jgi:hypothetical protein
MSTAVTPLWAFVKTSPSSFLSSYIVYVYRCGMSLSLQLSASEDELIHEPSELIE